MFNFKSTPDIRVNPRLNFQKNTTPTVSIITPYFNAGKYLFKTASTVLAQTLTDFEWIIINDGSTDDHSLKILEDIKLLDERIKIIDSDHKGVSNARNKGFMESRSSYIVPLDADDYIESTYLEKCWWALQAYPEASWAYTDSIGFGDQEYLWKKSFDSEWLKSFNFLVVTAMVKKEAWECVGGFEDNGYEDWQFWLKLIRKEKFPVHIKGYEFWYRRSTNSRSESVRKDNLQEEKSLQMIKKITESFKHNVKSIELGNLTFTTERQSKHSNLLISKNINEHSIKKKSVLFFFPWLCMGGSDKFNLDLISNLNREKFNIIICTTLPSENEWNDRFLEYCDEIYHLPNFIPVNYWPTFIYQKIINTNAEIVFISNSQFGYELIPWLKIIKPNLIIVDLIHAEEKNWGNGGYVRMSSDSKPYLNRTYVTSNSLKEVMITEYGRAEDELHVFYTNIDAVNLFNPDLIPKGDIRNKLGISNDLPVILFPCRLVQQKQPILMLEIVRTLKSRGYSFMVWVVGTGQEESVMRSFVKKYKLYDTVIFWGENRDLRPFYKDADFTLICSIKEGITLTTFESMAMGTPVISSNVGGQKELVHEGTGILVPISFDEVDCYSRRKYKNEEIEPFVFAIEKLFQDRKSYKQLPENARNYILANFQLQHMIQYFENELLNKLNQTNENLYDPSILALELFIKFMKRTDEAHEIWRALESCRNSQ